MKLAVACVLIFIPYNIIIEYFFNSVKGYLGFYIRNYKLDKKRGAGESV